MRCGLYINSVKMKEVSSSSFVLFSFGSSCSTLVLHVQRSLLLFFCINFVLRFQRSLHLFIFSSCTFFFVILLVLPSVRFCYFVLHVFLSNSIIISFCTFFYCHALFVIVSFVNKLFGAFKESLAYNATK